MVKEESLGLMLKEESLWLILKEEGSGLILIIFDALCLVKKEGLGFDAKGRRFRVDF